MMVVINTKGSKLAFARVCITLVLNIAAENVLELEY